MNIRHPQTNTRHPGSSVSRGEAGRNGDMITASIILCTAAGIIVILAARLSRYDRRIW